MGMEAPLNTPIVVRLSESVTDSDAPPFAPTLSLHATTSDEIVHVPASILGLSLDGELSFVPEATLPPSTTFLATFLSGQDAVTTDRPPGTTWSFRTGTETLPSLSLEGELSVTLEAGEVNALECPNNCGCTATGAAFAVTKARVELPRLVGGFPTHRGELWLTDNTPYHFDLPTVEPDSHVVQLGGQLSRDELAAGEALITLPSEDVAYSPCFSFRALDARGDQVLSPALCLEEDVFVGAPATDSPGATSSDDATSPRRSSACSFAPATESPQMWLPSLLLLGVLSRRRTLQRWGLKLGA
jgi:hypothetical protein